MEYDYRHCPYCKEMKPFDAEGKCLDCSNERNNYNKVIENIIEVCETELACGLNLFLALYIALENKDKKKLCLLGDMIDDVLEMPSTYRSLLKTEIEDYLETLPGVNGWKKTNLKEGQEKSVLLSESELERIGLLNYLD